MQNIPASMQKDFVKQNQENIIPKKYCLTRLKDGVYQEVTEADL